MFVRGWFVLCFRYSVVVDGVGVLCVIVCYFVGCMRSSWIIRGFSYNVRGGLFFFRGFSWVSVVFRSFRVCLVNFSCVFVSGSCLWFWTVLWGLRGRFVVFRVFSWYFICLDVIAWVFRGLSWDGVVSGEFGLFLLRLWAAIGG